jgi:hypothetical protein
MCNQQVTDVMNFAEYIPNPPSMSNTLHQDILSDLVDLCALFKINRSLWIIEEKQDKGFSLSSNVSAHYVTVSFGKNKITFNGYSIDWVEFSTTDHDTDFFAAILAMIMVKSEAEIAHTTPVEALQSL